MSFAVQALTIPSTKVIDGDGAVEYPVVWGCVVAAVLLDYTAGSGGSAREVSIQVYNREMVLVGVAPAKAPISPGTTAVLAFCLGGIESDTVMDGVIPCSLPTLPMTKGYTLRVSQTGAVLDADDTVSMTVHLLK